MFDPVCASMVVWMQNDHVSKFKWFALVTNDERTNIVKNSPEDCGRNRRQE